MKTNIEFKPATESASSSDTLWASPAKSTFQDLILKPEYKQRRINFPSGRTWFRVVPAMPTSDKGWMLGVHTLNYPGGRHAHPRSCITGGKSVFDHAYSWYKQHQPEALFSKNNKLGYRFLTDSVCLCWVLVEEQDRVVARLLVASGYDGSRGGVPGLGHQIWQLALEKDEEGDRIGNPAHPETGTQISVEKSHNPGTRYPRYTLKRGRVVVPINDLIARMEPEEIDALAPLESLIHTPTEDEEWQLLGNVLDEETCLKIREATS